jgi:hypothetical protein
MVKVKHWLYSCIQLTHATAQLIHQTNTDLRVVSIPSVAVLLEVEPQWRHFVEMTSTASPVGVVHSQFMILNAISSYGGPVW